MNAQISPSRSEPLALVGSFLARTHALFIDGKFVPAQSGETFDVINPGYRRGFRQGCRRRRR